MINTFAFKLSTAQTKFRNGLAALLLRFKLELLLLALSDDVAEFPLESALGMKLIRVFDWVLLPVVGLMGWGILFGDFIGDRVWLTVRIGDSWELPICVVFTVFELTKFGMEEFLQEDVAALVGLMDESFV